jgi:hypothetical protein
MTPPSPRTFPPAAPHRVSVLGMKMADVRVGMKLRSTTGESAPFDEITVTAITPKGFEYSIKEEMTFIARDGSRFCRHGHEHFGVDGYALYEPFPEEFAI